MPHSLGREGINAPEVMLDLSSTSHSPAVQGLDLEIISVEVNLVPKEADLFVEEHPNSTQNCFGGKFFLFVIEYLIHYLTKIIPTKHPPKCD